MSDELRRHRQCIDALDDEIVRLVNQRAGHAQAIGKIKDAVIYRPEREAQVLRRVQANNPGPLADAVIGRLMREIMSACLALEKELLVAYVGPAGTFTETAAVKHFGQAVRTEACALWEDVFRQVEAEHADYGVVPVENSTFGAENRTLDLLLQSPLKVCGEVPLRIHQHLLRRGEGLEDIRRVYSHAQSFGQCHEWLNEHLPGVSRVAVASNAEAARLAGQEAGAAAIAGEAAASLYGLAILARNIEDDPNNTTRFLVIGRHDAAPSGRDKTSLILSAANRPGAIVELLSPFARNGVSMTKLESRPSRMGPWEYVFFVDIEGHRQDEAVARSLDELRAHAAFVKILGSYPAAVL